MKYVEQCDIFGANNISQSNGDKEQVMKRGDYIGETILLTIKRTDAKAMTREEQKTKEGDHILKSRVLKCRENKRDTFQKNVHDQFYGIVNLIIFNVVWCRCFHDN